MATLTVAQTTFAGVLIGAATAAGGGDKFLNDGSARFYAKNGSGGSITVTVATPGKPGGQTITPVAIVLAAGAEKFAGPFDPAYFNDATGFVNLTYSGVTSLTVAPFK